MVQILNRPGLFSRVRCLMGMLSIGLLIAGNYSTLAQTGAGPKATGAKTKRPAEIAPINRMGSANSVSFDDGWTFARYGLQADGTRIEEPRDPQTASFDDGHWQRLSLPHDWAITGPFRIELEGATGKLPWKGIGWYRKRFTVPASDAGKKIFLDFDGAMAYAKIWLNGQYVGTWPYGYSSFRMDLTPFLSVGKENVLAVRLDTEEWDSRWYPGAGIYRHVWLTRTNRVYVPNWGTCITTSDITDNHAHIQVSTQVRNDLDKKAEVTLRTSFYELDGQDRPGKKVADAKEVRVRLGQNSDSTVTCAVDLSNPKRWDIETPNRYVAITTISVAGGTAAGRAATGRAAIGNVAGTDTFYTPFGIRTLEFTARNGFLLNGRRVQIQGTCNHGDLGALGVAINTSALKRQLILLKDMGCNSLRTSHNPPPPELLELADKMGFLVWDEAFDAWQHGKRKNDYNKLFKEWHEKDLTALVHRDRNHPSVFIWSIGNEVMDQRDVELTRHLADIVHREDPTRPVSNGYNDPDGGRESGAAMALDIMGVNYFFGQQPKWDKDPRYSNKPTIGSETSSCVSSRGEYFFGKPYRNWQISSYDNAYPGWGCSPDQQFRTLSQYPHLLGEYVWTGFDYLGEPTPYNSDETNLLNFRTDPAKQEELKRQLEQLRQTKAPSRSSYFGIIDLAGFPKDRYYSYQSEWRPELPLAHIFPHWNWPERLDSIVPVHVYTSGDEGELFLNGRSLGRRKKTAGVDYRLTWDSVQYAPGELRVVCYKNGKPWATDTVRTTGAADRLLLSADREEIKSDGAELCFITVKVTDKDGLTVPRSNPLIRFHIEGPGEIVATDNGDATSFVPFQSKERPAYNGMALVIVRANKRAHGRIRVVAESNGLSDGTVDIRAK